MIREDLITQMIQQIAALIARILKRNISQESMEEELNDLAGKWIGLPSELLLTLPPEEAFRLLEDSDRMVIEKSYFMGEMFRSRGIKSESPNAKKDFFAKALFFYGKCSGRVSEKLQEIIDQTIEELRIAGSEEAYSEPENDFNDTLQATEARRFESQRVHSPPLAALVNPAIHRDPKPEGASRRDAPPRSLRGRRSRGLAPGWRDEVEDIHSIPASANRRKKRTPKMLWYAIAACLLAIGFHSFFEENEIEITDRISGFEGGLAQAEFQIVNNTNQERLIRLRFSVEHSTREVFGSEYTFLGAAEREYNVAPQSTQKINEEFEYALKSPRANQTISIVILSNESMDTTPVGAPY